VITGEFDGVGGKEHLVAAPVFTYIY